MVDTCVLKTCAIRGRGQQGGKSLKTFGKEKFISIAD